MPRYEDPVASLTFRASAPIPAQDVWSVLTCAQSPLFPGMTVDSTWQPGDPVAFVPAQRSHVPAPSGRVLHVDPPYRLSFSIEDEDSGTATYVAWTLRPNACGCVVRLHVHDVGAHGEDDVEDAWLPVIEALRDLVRSRAG